MAKALKALRGVSAEPQPTKPDDDGELLVCALSFFTAYGPDGKASGELGDGSYYKENQQYLSSEIGPRIHPEWFLPAHRATGTALAAIRGREIAVTEARAAAVREKTEAAIRPEPPKVYGEHEFMICIKPVGVEDTGGRAASRMMLVGTLVRPDDPWYLANRSCFQSVLPKGAKPEQCLVCTETHGAGKRRLFAGEFVRDDDPRVEINAHCFRSPRQAPAGMTTWNTYVMEGS